MSHDKENNQVIINMKKYIEDVIGCFKEALPDEKIKAVTTPATNNLFKTRLKNVYKITKQKSMIFRATVAKLLFVAKRARPDILLVISFLTT